MAPVEIKTPEEFRSMIIQPLLKQYLNLDIVNDIFTQVEVYHQDGLTKENLEGYLLTMYDVAGEQLGDKTFEFIQLIESYRMPYEKGEPVPDLPKDNLQKDIDDIINRLVSSFKENRKKE